MNKSYKIIKQTKIKQNRPEKLKSISEREESNKKLNLVEILKFTKTQLILTLNFFNQNTFKNQLFVYIYKF